MSARKRPSRRRLARTPAPPARKMLYAPWRIEYIRQLKNDVCFFCQAAQLPEQDAGAWKQRLLLYRDAHVLVVLNRYPYTGGHLMVAPCRHTADFPALAAKESLALWETSRACVRILAAAFKPHGFNVGLNLGRAAGAGIAEHLHVHVVPRWVGDTNFMPVLGSTTAVPVALEELWEELRPAFREIGGT